MTTEASIFPAPAFEGWTRRLLELTPVERVGEMLFKREDRFAPLGYGGINGGKLRQCIHLIHRYVQGGGAAGVLTAASVRSPQLSSTAAVAKHFGLPTVIVIAGGQKTCLKHSNVAVAAGLGARVDFCKVGYNPALQRRARELADGPLRGWYLLEYGIGVPRGASPEETEEFHSLGAHQVSNIPEGVRTILLPAGSCNTAVSVLYGLARQRPASLSRVILFGIGPSRLRFIRERLTVLEAVSGLDILGLYDANFPSDPDEQAGWPAAGAGGEIRLDLFDLHGSGYAAYDDEHKRSYYGIEFHSRYEGKVWSFMERDPSTFAHLLTPETLFWVVGSRPSQGAMPMIPRVESVERLVIA